MAQGALDVSTGLVCGDGPFVEIGVPTAVDQNDDWIVVGGDLGVAQWNGHDVQGQRYIRASVAGTRRGTPVRAHDLGATTTTRRQYPVGIYDRTTLRCVRLFFSHWPVNSIAIDPRSTVVAIGTGSYDGGYSFEGELLIHDLRRGGTVSVLAWDREVLTAEWRDATRLAVTMAPFDDESGTDGDRLRCDEVEIGRTSWAEVAEGMVGLRIIAPEPGWQTMGLPTTPVTRSWQQMDPAGDPGRRAELSRTLEDVAAEHGRRWRLRRQAWAVLPTDDGVVVGLDGGVERWGSHGGPIWRADLDGMCTQLFDGGSETGVAAVWVRASTPFVERSTRVVTVDLTTGGTCDLADPGRGVIVVQGGTGEYLLRSTWPVDKPVLIVSTSHVAPPTRRRRPQLGSHDPFRDYFDIRRAPELLVTVGTEPQVAAVRQIPRGWDAEPLFPLTWQPGIRVQGGPGVWVDDAAGQSIVQSGRVASGGGLLPGNAFVVRRRYPTGDLMWHTRLDTVVTGVDERDGTVVAVTNVGQVVAIDTLSGEVRAGAHRSDRNQRRGRPVYLELDGAALAPLSLALTSGERGWVGTHDGRAVEIVLDGART